VTQEKIMKYNQKHIYNISCFTNENAISYYLLGAFMTDGGVDRNLYKIHLTSADLDWLELIRNYICPTLKISKHDNAYRLKIYNKEITKWFLDHGCIPAKSLTLIFPKIPIEYLADFIRGCIDGDGSIGSYSYTKTKGEKQYHYKTKICYLCSASFNFIEPIYNILNSLGFIGSLKEQKKKDGIINNRIIPYKNKIYRLTFSGKKTIKFLNWIYYSNHELSMPRKLLLANKICNTTN
jgi:hypothetical protein